MTIPQITVYMLFPIAGYFLGAIPFAWVIGKAHGVDIRTVGSKNIGATNLGRTLGRRFFWQAFFLDALKGFLPVLGASCVTLISNAHFHGNLPQAARGGSHSQLPPGPLVMWAPLLTAAACFLGHVFPVYLKFKGGKGVATSFGVVLGFWPVYTIAGLLSGLFFVFVLMVYRYISLASMTASLVFVGLVAVFSVKGLRYVDTFVPMPDRMVLIAVAGFFSLVIIWRHRSNIGRLLRGTESKIGQREIEKAKLKPLNTPPAPPAK